MRRERHTTASVRFSEGLSSTWEPVSNAAPQPALPADGPVRSLRQQFSRCANVCRVMPFRPCYPRVDPLPDPDLCCSCVGRSSPRSAVAPAPRAQRACPRPEDRPPPATPLVSHPSSYPCGQAGNDAVWRGQEAQAAELIEATMRQATARGLGGLVSLATYASSVLYNGPPAPRRRARCRLAGIRA